MTLRPEILDPRVPIAGIANSITNSVLERVAMELVRLGVVGDPSDSRPLRRAVYGVVAMRIAQMRAVAELEALTNGLSADLPRCKYDQDTKYLYVFCPDRQDDLPAIRQLAKKVYNAGMLGAVVRVHTQAISFIRGRNLRRWISTAP